MSEQSVPRPLPPLITLEEHFFSEASLTGPSSETYAEQLKYIPGLLDKLKDLGPLRLESMNENAITLQIISHGPTQPQMNPAQCRAANLQLHEALCANSDRFAGFACLPMGEPDEASKELAYCVEELGFVGALVDNHASGKTYEGPEYGGFWYTVQSLGVPVYLHPSWATDQMRRGVFPDFNPDADVQTESSALSASAVNSLMASSWNWHSDVALHVFKLFAAGIFDKFPRLKIVIGHFGEMIPFMLARIYQLSPRWGKRDRDFKQVWDGNIWITTSGVWSLDPLRCILHNTKKDRILFSVDYPFARNESGKKWMEELIGSGLCTLEEIEMIAYRNAEKLLGVRVKSSDEAQDHRDVADKGQTEAVMS